MTRSVPEGFSREVLLGSGRSGRVWRAHQDDVGRMVALKEVPCRSGLDRDALRREAVAIGSKELLCLPRLYSVEFGAGRGWIVQEYIHGVSVSSLHHGGLEPDEARWLAHSVVVAIAALHGAGRSHGDLDPGHLILEPSGRLRMIDLGLSVAKTESVRGGSSGYLAPESGRPDADPLAAEIWGLGVLLHELLCGTRPGHRGPDREGLSRIGRWRDIVLSCLSSEPAQRPKASALVEVLDDQGPLPFALLQRVGAQADVDLARRLKETGRSALGRKNPRAAWDCLSEAANLDPDDAETLDLLSHVRLGPSRRPLIPWLAVGLVASLALGLFAWWTLSSGEPPNPTLGIPTRPMEERLSPQITTSTPLPLREGRSP